MTGLLAARPPGGVWTVAGLIGAVASVLQGGFPACTVTGQISGFSRAASGHCYFSLKDAAGGATLRCAMFRRAASMLAFLPADGQLVELRGRLAVYEPRGELQFVGEAMQPSGPGALYERYLLLKSRLAGEGLFDAGSKRALPSFPLMVGVVTSLAGAALHDVATTLARRSPHVGVVVYPSLVQGADAPSALCQAIARAGKRAEVDVLIVCRGGGSLEDLWAFNDERVVREIRATPMPVISGVGHETDVTLTDLAADLRAPTPTAAAELAAPATAQQLQALGEAGSAIARRGLAILQTQAQRIDRLALRLARPAEAVRRRAHVFDVLAERLSRAPLRAVESGLGRHGALASRLRHALALARAYRASRMGTAAVRLRALDPEQVLTRGYALLADPTGHPLTSIAQIIAGDRLVAHLRDGQAMLVATAVVEAPAASEPSAAGLLSA